MLWTFTGPPTNKFPGTPLGTVPDAASHGVSNTRCNSPAAACRAMRQPSLHQVLGLSRRDRQRAPEGSLEVYDFFAGAGGFSEGARQAGCSVTWMCDNNPSAIKTHASNHPLTEHCLVELPMPPADLPFPTDGRAFHCHFSPPCQLFSVVNRYKPETGDRSFASDLVTWSLETALASGATSWSLEQVYTPVVVALVEAVSVRYPGLISYAQFNFAHLGVPQTRKRLLAGPPHLIAKMLRLCTLSKKRSVEDVIAAPRGRFIRYPKNWCKCIKRAGQKNEYVKADWGHSCYAVTGPSPTVLAERNLNWVTPTKTGYEHSALLPSELSLLQTFPTTYRWPSTKIVARSQIGNAVPPLISKLLLSPEPVGRPGSPSLRRAAVMPVWA